MLLQTQFMLLLQLLAVVGFVAAAPGSVYEREDGRANRRSLLNGIVGAATGLIGVQATYDYVIVGGGTAGLVMASRLSENSSLKIAVVEAGTLYEITDPIFSSTPAGDTVFVGASTTDENPLYDWDFVTEPQAGANGRQVHYARGRCLGGRSVKDFFSCHSKTSRHL
jgi:hypothetical protein